jgi:RAT1-interacting protein
MRHHSNAADYYREYNLSLDSKPGRPAEYQSPFQIATFSYNAEREQVFDDSSLKYYVEPPPNANLTYRFDNWKRKPEDRTRLDPLLAACAQNKLSRAETKRADVITWRGVLTK